MGYAILLQGHGELFHLFGQQGRAVELHHLQAAMDLMNAFQAVVQRLQGLGLIRQVLQRLIGLAQGFGNFALDPFQGHIVMPINHNHSSQSLVSVSGCHWWQAPGSPAR